jgi:hypothetical protein
MRWDLVGSPQPPLGLSNGHWQTAVRTFGISDAPPSPPQAGPLRVNYQMIHKAAEAWALDPEVP